MDNNLTGNFKLMREMNTAMIMRTIWNHSPISRSEIVELTNLTGATVSRIVSKLIDRGFVVEVGYGESSGGRKPILVELNPEAALVIGIDIEVDEIIGIVIDLNGKVLEETTNKIKNTEEDQIITQVKDMIKGFVETKGYKEKIMGIGIGIHGIVDYYEGLVVYPPAFGWSDLPLAQIINDEFGYVTVVENNNRALALGESWFGAGQNVENFVCLKVGTGIGSGIFTNGEIYRGVSHSSGEIGHTTVDEDGELCSCGNYGCLETMASIPTIIQRAKKLIKQGADTKIYNLVDGEIDDIDETVIFAAAREGDSISRQILRDEGRYLGIGIANSINILNPEAVIIGGKIVEAGDYVLDSLKKTVKNRALTYSVKHVKIIPGSLGKQGIAIGAATLILEQIFKFDKFKF